MGIVVGAAVIVGATRASRRTKNTVGEGNVGQQSEQEGTTGGVLWRSCTTTGEEEEGETDIQRRDGMRS
jgi:hypothetical protein